MLYLAHSRVGSVKYSVIHFPPKLLEALHSSFLSGGTQRRSKNKSEEMKILNISSPRVGIEPTICRVYSHTVLLRYLSGLTSKNNFY